LEGLALPGCGFDYNGFVVLGEAMMTNVPVKADKLEVNEAPDGYVIYEGSQDRVHYLNRTAAVVFELCDGERRIEEIISGVAELFNLEPKACDKDVRGCLESLSKEGLVQFRSE
jgi:hypothetical protein